VSLALVGARIYTDPDAQAIACGTVLIDGTRIASVGPAAHAVIPAGTRIVDCNGLTITAGFWNCHVHFFERKWAGAASIPAAILASHLAAYSRHGFTSVVDLSSKFVNTQSLRARIESGEIHGPRIRSTGEGLVPPNALPPDAVLETMGLMKTPLPEVRDAAQAVAAVRTLLESGVDAIKMFASGSSTDAGSLTLELMRAVVEEAHEKQRPVFVHPNSAGDIVRALDAGADVIAHTTPRTPWDDALLQLIATHKPALTPTLMLSHERGDEVSDQLREWIANGGVVLFGTDAGAVTIDPTGELALMAQAGMAFRDILSSLTTAPARFFGLKGELGRIAPGYTADIVVFAGDPEIDVLALSRVLRIVQNGTLISV